MARPSIFVTGAASGIGRATARLFAERGWFVGLYDASASALESVARELDAFEIETEVLDVTDAAALSGALERFWDAAGQRLDVMFNCAGIASVGDFESIALARHHQIVDVNLKGVINGCHVALPYLRQTSGARVINMASASAIYGTPSFASYSATKFAVRALTEALDIEWARHGIRVMAIWPVFVATPMVASMDPSLPAKSRMGVRLTAEDIARVVWKAATRPRWLTRLHWLVGIQTWIMAWSTRFLPRSLGRITTRWLTGY